MTVLCSRMHGYNSIFPEEEQKALRKGINRGGG